MAKGLLYRAEIRHNENTVEALYKMQFYTYEKARVYLRMGIGLACILTAAFASLPIWAKGILLLIGAWLVVTPDFQGSVRADKAMQARKGNVPSMEYEFHADNFRIGSGENSKTLAYKKIDRLAVEKDYLYLFLAKDSVCMIDRSTLKPADDEGFMKFIEEKTGLPWRREHDALMVNFWDIKDMIDDRKKH